MRISRNVNSLFDLDWYSKESKIDFGSIEEAVNHYIEKGESKGYFPNPIFDPEYYRDKYGLDEKVNAFMDFCESGLASNKNPNSLFLSDWYKWQNPESEPYPHPIFHYISVGGEKFLDPSPFVDMEMVRRTQGEGGGGVALLSLILKGKYDSGLGISHSYEQLASSQRRFIDKNGIFIHKQKPANERKKCLVWVQCTLGTEFFKWYRKSDREWDLLLNFYDDSVKRSDLGDFVVSQRGTKFTAIFNIWRQTDFLDTYDYLMFIDDDLIFKYKDVDKCFNIVKQEGIDLSQPSLSKGSYCAWPVFFNAKSKGVRLTNGVEIMMPVFSKRCFSKAAPYFSMSVSGFGLDLLFAKLASDNKFRAAVVDEIKVSHYSEINQNTGAYYEMIRKNGINSKYELWSLVDKFGLETEFYEI